MHPGGEHLCRSKEGIVRLLAGFVKLLIVLIVGALCVLNS